MGRIKKISIAIGFALSGSLASSAYAACPPKFCGGPVFDAGAISSNILDKVQEHAQWVIEYANEIQKYTQTLLNFTNEIIEDNKLAASKIIAKTDAEIGIYNSKLVNDSLINAQGMCVDAKLAYKSSEAACKLNENQNQELANIAGEQNASPEQRKEAINNYVYSSMLGVNQTANLPDQYDSVYSIDPSNAGTGTSPSVTATPLDMTSIDKTRLAVTPLPSAMIAKPEGDSDAKARDFIKVPVIGDTRISSHFNPNRFHPVLNEIRPHKGVDFAGPKGLPIIASQEGRVVFAGNARGYGNVVYVNHEDGVQTRYAHLDTITVSSGQSLEKGQIVGSLGNTGVGTGPHLHYEYRINDIAIDPMNIGVDQKYGATLEAMKFFTNTGTYSAPYRSLSSVNAQSSGVMEYTEDVYEKYKDTEFANLSLYDTFTRNFINNIAYQHLSKPTKLTGFDGESSVGDGIFAVGSSEFGSESAIVRAKISDDVSNRSADIAWKNKLSSSAKRLYLKLKRYEQLVAIETALGAKIQTNYLMR